MSKSVTQVASPLINAKTVAHMIGVEESTLAQWRCLHPDKHPPYMKIGRSVKFRLSEVEAWIEAQRVIAPASK